MREKELARLLKEHFRAMEDFRNVSGMSVLQAVNQVAKAQKSIDQVTRGTQMPGIRQIRKISESMRRMPGPAEMQLINQMGKMARELNISLGQGMSSVKMLSDSLAKVEAHSHVGIQSILQCQAAQKQMLTAFGSSTMADVVGELQSLEVGESDIDEVVQRIEGHFSDQIQELPEGRISVEGILNMLLTVLLFLISSGAQNESEEKWDCRFKDFEFNVMNKIEKLANPAEEGIFYIVKVAVHLRQGASSKTDSLGVLFPNQRVKLLERKKKWIKIEYFNYQDANVKTGWVFKKYLKMEKEIGGIKWEFKQ